MRFKVATLAAVLVLVALLANHLVAPALAAAHASPAGRPPNDFGVELPGYLRFLVKLDHFAVDYGYVLIPLVWVAAFVVASVGLGLWNLLGGPQPAGIPERDEP